MSLHPSAFAIAAAVMLPVLSQAQHSHGGGGTDVPPRRAERERPSPPAAQRGLLPPGSPRQVEVLVLSYGFSPTSIRAEAGEEIVLLVKRIDDPPCAKGLAIPAKELLVELPLNETVPVTLKLERAETIELACANEDVRASIVVGPR